VGFFWEVSCDELILGWLITSCMGPP